jgi:beta-phosphoglucomutase-like phosphatase (HAD superfamily)
MSQLQAVIFGSIGTIAETSDIQRQAFNLAFAEAGLDWNWDAIRECQWDRGGIIWSIAIRSIVRTGSGTATHPTTQ